MFDSQVMSAVMKELHNKLVKGKIQKIIQPSPTETVISFYSPVEKNQLLISVHPSMSRVHLTRQRYHQASIPPKFCMLLRKHLEGGAVSGIYQPPWERILKLYFFKGTQQFQLITEIMGRHSNLILLDPEEIILGAIKYVTPEMSSYRTVLPGKPYYPPPSPQKFLPGQVDKEDFKQWLFFFRNRGMNWAKALISCLHGISPLMAEELVQRARMRSPAGDSEFVNVLWEVLQSMIRDNRQKNFYPTVYQLNDGSKTYGVHRFYQYENSTKQKFSSINDLLDNYYSRFQKEQRKKEVRSRLKEIIDRELKRVYLKEEKQGQDLKKAEKAEEYRLYGELILSQLTQISRGSKEATLINLYQPEQNQIKIPLDPRLPPHANAERYFKKYRRAQKSKEQIKIQKEKTRREARYLENVSYSLENAGLSELEEISRELEYTGYVKPDSRGGKSQKSKPPKSEPLSFTSSQGYRILVGRNNTQNEQVTFKMGSREDTWLHAQKIPGSHVVIKGCPYPPTEETLQEAAALAAYYSKNRELPRVTIDYTQVKHVKRAPGGKPGMVTYKNFKSISVAPQKTLSQQEQLLTE